jgi:phosphate transport system substrate-binding protein
MKINQNPVSIPAQHHPGWLLGLGVSLALGISVIALAQTTIVGEGASFPKVLYDKLFAEYEKATTIKVEYSASGSGAGQRAILAQKVDFGATDIPLTTAQLQSAPDKNTILHVPIAMGAVVPVYNLPGVKTQLRFDAKTIANIYLGKITKWNDPALKQLNPNATLPNLDISVVYREDASGTTGIWVDYLAKAAPEWRRNITDGAATTVDWRVGLGVPQSSGMIEQVQGLAGAIGYMDFISAKKNSLSYGLVRNQAGNFVDGGNLKAVSAAARGESIPADTKVFVTDTDNPDGYPISGFTWVLVYENQQYGNRSEAQGKNLASLLRWMIEDSNGQRYHEALGFAQLPDSAQIRAKALVNKLRYGGKLLR